MHLFKGLLIVPVLWASTALGAEPPMQQSQEIIELDEILVQGRQPVENAQKMIGWLSRLVGEFRYEGHVERPGSGTTAADRAEVQGGSQCWNIGSPGLVHCLMNVTWQEKSSPESGEIPGGASSLIPAVALYGMYAEYGPASGGLRDPRYIGHMQVDDRGIAETGIGQLFDDTLIYKATCADLPGDCQRVVHIEAPPDRKIIRMSVEIQRDSKLEVRYVFEWHRVSETPAATASGPAIAARANSTIVPADTQNWMRQLVGNFRFGHFAMEQIVPMQSGTSKCLIDPISIRNTGLSERCPSDTSSREECLGIGSGLGVRCMRDMGWQEARVPASRYFAAFELWGYDASARNIIYAWASPGAMDKLGGLLFAAGRLNRNTLTITSPCPVSRCGTYRINISADGKRVQQSMDRGSLGALVRIDNASAEIPANAPKVRNPSPRRP